VNIFFTSKKYLKLQYLKNSAMNDHLDHVANKMCMEEKWIALKEIL
jgi:hypothetical protein